MPMMPPNDSYTEKLTHFVNQVEALEKEIRQAMDRIKGTYDEARAHDIEPSDISRKIEMRTTAREQFLKTRR